jgi:hypothetical protein
MADIYVDSAAGGAADGTTPTDAYTTIAAATLTAGDTIWVRRTHAEVPSTSYTIGALAADSSVAICGWPISGDDLYASRPAAGQAAWDGDSTSAMPTLSPTANYAEMFNSGATANLNIAIYRLKAVYAGTTGPSGFYLGQAAARSRHIIKYCEIGNGLGRTSSYEVIEIGRGTLTVEDCTITLRSSNQGIKQNGTTSDIYVHNTTIDGGGTIYFNISSGSCSLQIFGGSFGATTGPTTSYFQGWQSNAGQVVAMGCTYGSGTLWSGTGVGQQGQIDSIHHDDTLDAYQGGVGNEWWFEATTGTVRSGGGSPSIICEQKGTAHRYDNSRQWYPPSRSKGSFCVFASADTEITISVYAYAAEYTTVPDDVQLRADYISAATGTMSRAFSAQSFSAKDTWTEFSVTITPAADGLVYLSFDGYIYEAGAPTREVLVDPLPVVA